MNIAEYFKHTYRKNESGFGGGYADKSAIRSSQSNNKPPPPPPPPPHICLAHVSTLSQTGEKSHHSVSPISALCRSGKREIASDCPVGLIFSFRFHGSVDTSMGSAANACLTYAVFCSMPLPI